MKKNNNGGLMNFFKRLLRVGTVGAVFLVASGHVNAAVEKETKSEVSQSLEKITYPLSHFMAENKPIRLGSTSSRNSLYIPVSAREDFKSMTLSVDLTNSISLLPDRSQVAVSLNGHIVAQLPLSPKTPETHAVIRLPVEWLKTGYNQLEFAVAQHVVPSCEDPSVAELWTEINTVSSRLSVEMAPRNLSPLLSSLGQIFDAKQWTPRKLLIATAGTSDDELKWGGLAAQGVALRLKHVPLQVEHALLPSLKIETGPVKASDGHADMVLTGTVAQLSATLSKEQAAQIKGAFVGIYPAPANSSQYMIVLSGKTPEEVSRAALAFALLSQPFPESQTVIVDKLTLPQLNASDMQSGVLPDRNYRFSDMGFRTSIARGYSGEEPALTFNVPPDLYASERARVDLMLHFSYGAGLRGDSVMNIFLNGAFERAVRLDDHEGASYQNYKVSIPLRSLQPGLNRLSFNPILMPVTADITGACQSLYFGNAVFTLFDDSALSMPVADHYAQLPNLGYLARTGFPYVTDNGSQMLVALAGKDSRVIAAGWMLVAKLAQKKGYPLYEAAYTAHPDKNNAKDRDIIAVGILQGVPEVLLQDGPFQHDDKLKFDYGVPVVSPAKALGWFEKIWTRLYEMGGLNYPDARMASVAMTGTAQNSGLGTGALLAQYESPLGAHKSLTLITAPDSRILYGSVSSLVQPELWEGLKGGIVTWHPGDAELQQHDAHGQYSVGSISMLRWMGFNLSQHPWWWYVIIVAVIAALAFLTKVLLLRFKQRHHGDLKTEDGHKE